jgi:hypothetical protein
MPLDLDKLMKEGKQQLSEKRPEFSDKNPNTNPVDAKKPTDVKAAVPPKVKTWDKEFQPIIDAAGFDEAVNYGNSLHIMKAINGRYDNVLNSGEIDDSVKKTIKSLKNNSWSAMKELKKIAEGYGDAEVYNKYRVAADAADLELTSQIGYGLGKNYVYDNKKKTITKKAEAERNHQGWETDEDEGGSTEANVGGGGVNPYAGYNQVKSFETRSREQIKNTVNPIVSTWTKNSFRLLNASNETSSKYDPDVKDNTIALSKSVLTFVSKYGTQSGNKKIDEQNKKTASNLLNKLTDPKLDYQGKIALLKRTSTAETNVIQDMVSQMGYYGSRAIYTKYKDIHGKKTKYYENGADEYANSGLDSVDGLILNADSYFENTKLDRLKAKENVKTESGRSHPDMVFNNLVDDKGRITDYNTWLKKMGYDAKSGDLGELKFNKSTGDYSYNPLLSVFKEGKGDWDTRNIIGTYGKPIEYLDKNGRARRSNGNRLYTSDKKTFNEIMRGFYNEAVKEYKAKFSDLNDPKVYKGVIQGVGGFGNTASKAVKLARVNMSLDKDGNMINTQDYNGRTAESIFKLMLNSDGSVNTKDVTLFDEFEIEEGKDRTASKDYLNSKSELNFYPIPSIPDLVNTLVSESTKGKDSNAEKFKSFFGQKDLKDIKITFTKNASIDYHGKYIFTNLKTGQKLAMVAPASYLNAKNDFAWKNSQLSADEGRFLRNGKKVLPDRDGLYKNAEIIDDNGIKVATFNYLDADGVSTEYRLPIGDVNIKEATNYFNDYVRNIMMP